MVCVVVVVGVGVGVLMFVCVWLEMCECEVMENIDVVEVVEMLVCVCVVRGLDVVVVCLVVDYDVVVLEMVRIGVREDGCVMLLLVVLIGNLKVLWSVFADALVRDGMMMLDEYCECVVCDVVVDVIEVVCGFK